jgi:ribosomal protein S18 acetylase RimI-like enzyme
MITAATKEGLLLVDIALMPAFRNRGWGSLLVRALQDEARGSGTAMLLQVEIWNPALALYRRLGFIAEGDDGIRYWMRWNPAQSTA